MEIVSNFERAFEIGRKCLQKSRNNISRTGEYSGFDVPSLDGPWEMSEYALQNTLSYILNFLNHSCYMLCVDETGQTMVKLETGRTSPFIEKIIYESIRKSRDYNIEDALLDRNGRLKNLRVMQCIVKAYARVSTTTAEYVNILKDAKLPDGVYILNLTDAVILRKGGLFPWQMVTGNIKLPNEFLFDKHIPILSTSGQEGFWDIPIPNYDDVDIVLSGKTHDFITEWSKKTIDKAVFRGGPTGCGYTPRTNMRIKLAEMGLRKENMPFLDVGIVGQPGQKSIDSKSIRFDPLYGMGYMKTGLRPVERMVMRGQSRHKYIIHVDGNVHAYRLLNTMRTGSLILRVKSEYTSWVDHLLKDGVHFISVKDDLSDLVEKIKFCKENDCSEIARNGMEMANQLLTKSIVVGAFENILWGVYANLNPKSPSPEKNISPVIPNTSPVVSNSSPIISNSSPVIPNTSPVVSNSSPAVSKKDSISDSLPDSLPSINDSIKSSVSPKISLPVKKKTRKIKIISDEEFFKKETQKIKRKRCPKGTRRNKAGFCVEIVQKEKVDVVEKKPIIVSEGTLQIDSFKMKDKKKRCPKGTRKNKMGDCVPK
jgi:hypothetical protein